MSSCNIHVESVVMLMQLDCLIFSRALTASNKCRWHQHIVRVVPLTMQRRIQDFSLVGHMARAVARAYNRDLGAEPPAPSRVQGRAPGRGFRGAKPPWSWKHLKFRTPIGCGKLPISLYFSFVTRNIYSSLLTYLRTAVVSKKWKSCSKSSM